MGNGTYLHEQRPPYKLLIRHHLAPGDVLVMTACIEALHRQYPGRYRVMVETTAQDIWDNNPHVESLVPIECHIMEVGYPLIQRAGKEPVHFLQGFCEHLGEQLGINLRLDTNRPSLYLSEAEKVEPDLPRPYVLVNAGHKTDFTAKFAGHKTYQEIVNHFVGRLHFVQIGENNPSHIHKRLDGVIDYVGKTSTRQLIRLAYHSSAGVGPVTFLHHIYGAFQKPYVCYIGGREDMSWEAYPTATMLTTIGQLACCQYKACWKSRTVKLDDYSGNNLSLCLAPVQTSCGETIPKCMEVLGSQPAIKALETMIESGVIK